MTTRSCHWRRGRLAAALAVICVAAPLQAQPVPIAAAPGPALVKPTFVPRNATGTYALGDTVAWTATLPSGAAPSPGGYLYIDTITPPVGIWTAFNQMRGPKELIPMIESDHNNRTPEKQGDWEARWRAVLKTLVSGGTFVPAPTATP